MNMAKATDYKDLTQQVDVMRQMVLLALGTNHRIYQNLDAAWRSGNQTRMQRALEELDNLPEADKRYISGMDHVDELTGTD